MGKFMTALQKVIVRSVLWCILAFAATISLKGDFGNFAVLCLPLIMYWVGVCIFGSGYLKKLGELFDFNLRAFIFSSFYYWYKGLSYWFVFYAWLPILIYTLLLVLLILCIPNPPDVRYFTLIVTYFTSHLLAGFRANRDIRAYEEYKAEVAKNANPDAPVMYFSVSVARLISLSVLSFGIYTIYWLFKNWKAVHTATKEDFVPFFRSWMFGIFFIYPLYTRIKKAAEKVQPVGRFLRVSCILFILIWVIAYVLNFNSVEQRFSSHALYLCAWILLAFIMALILIPAQKAIFVVNKSIDAKHTPSSSFARGEINIIVIGLILWITNVSVLFMENSLMDEIRKSVFQTLNVMKNDKVAPVSPSGNGQGNSLTELAGQSFGGQGNEVRTPSAEASRVRESEVQNGNSDILGIRQRDKQTEDESKMNAEDAIGLLTMLNVQETIIVPDVCAEIGYDMQNYPRVFEQTYQSEYDFLRRVLKKQGLTFKDGQDAILGFYGQQLRQKIAVQLEDFRKGYILGAVSEQYGVPVENLTWAQAFDDFLTPEQTCAMLDENAAVILGEDVQKKLIVDMAVETLKANPDLF